MLLNALLPARHGLVVLAAILEDLRQSVDGVCPALAAFGKAAVDGDVVPVVGQREALDAGGEPRHRFVFGKGIQGEGRIACVGITRALEEPAILGHGLDTKLRIGEVGHLCENALLQTGVVLDGFLQ